MADPVPLGADAPTQAVKSGPSFKETALRGSAFTMGGYAASQAIRLIGNIVLARVLFEEAFALMAITSAVMQGMVMFSDFGIGPSIVQNKRGDDPNFLNTAWTLQAMRGIVLASIMVAIAWPVAAFYAENDPTAWELRFLLPIVAMSTLISGFNSTKLSAATRHLQVGRVIAIELVVQSVSLVVMVTGAWLFKSVYALAVGYVVGSTVQCLMTHYAAPGINNRFRWDVSAVWEIVHFGKWIFLSTAISFFAMQLDKLAFGKMFPLDAVGVYGIAAGLAVLTPNLLSRLQGMIAFPIYSRAMNRDQPLKDVFERSKVPMLIVGGYLVAGCIACAQSFISFAYDDRYQAAGTYIIILTIGAWFEVIYGVYMNALLASGKAGSIAAMNGAKVATFCILVVPAAKFGGLAGAVTAVAASDFARTTACILFARKIGLRNHTSDVLFSAQAIGVGLGVYWLIHHSPIAPDSHPLVSLVLGGVFVSIAFIPSLLMAKRVIAK